MKRLAIHILIVLILCGVFCDGYFTFSQLSCGRVWLSDSEVYAADGWQAVTQDDLVTAFQYYCKSRNLTIDGSIADALTSFTTTTFNNICNTLGIDVTALQANLKKTVEGNLGLRFLMNQQGVLAYNRIFAEFLQNNDLAVGDTVNNEIVHSGEWFTDNNGHSCFVYYANSTDVTFSNDSKSDLELKQGSIYYFDSFSDFVSTYKTNSNQYHTLSVSAGSTDYSYSFYNEYQTSSTGELYRISNRSYGSSTYTFEYYRNARGTNNIVQEGWPCIWKDRNGYYFGCYGEYPNTDYSTFKGKKYKKITDGSSQPADITVNTPDNTVINNNTYNNNYTIIYNDGDTYITDDDDEPSPTTPPEGGGGGGGDDPDQPSPSGPDLPDWRSPHGTGTIGSDGTFDFDIPFSLPDLNIDWSLKNIGQKFPFCIPSDIVSFYQVLAVEPEAPAIDAHIPLGSFYDWHFEADFAQYDNWARIIRIVEYVGFVITLIYFTVKLVKG